MKVSYSRARTKASNLDYKTDGSPVINFLTHFNLRQEAHGPHCSPEKYEQRYDYNII